MAVAVVVVLREQKEEYSSMIIMNYIGFDTPLNDDADAKDDADVAAAGVVDWIVSTHVPLPSVLQILVREKIAFLSHY